MLTREIRDKWAEALESGKFNQCRNSLEQKGIITTRYCCIGVLGKINNNLEDAYTFLESQLPNKMELDGELITSINFFIRLNDTKNLSFREIAKIVRALPVVEDTPQVADSPTP